MSKKLGDLLVEQGRVTPLELQEALRAQRIFGGSLGTHLLQFGFLTEAELGAALEEVHGVPAVSRAELLAALPGLFALLPVDFARRHRALPFRIEGDALHLALQNPADSLALHEAAFLTGYRVVPHVAPEAVIRDALTSQLRGEPPGGTAPAPPAASGPGAPPPDVTTGPMRAASPPAAASAAPAAARPPAAAVDTNPVVVTRRGPPRTAVPPAPAPGPEPVEEEESPTAALHHPVAARGASAERPEGDGGDPLAETGRRLAAATTRDEVLAVALDEMASHFPRVCAFAIRGREAMLWRSSGLPRTPTRPVAIPLDESSILAFPDDGPVLRYGPVAATPANQDLYILLGGRIPRVVLVVPVQVKKRTVVVLYGDDPDGTAPPPDFVRVRRLAALTAWALEAVILRGKILRASGA
ncbi:MAG: hypothetical protein MUC67_13170 [Acidobacteria bacterium]|nr:hypothetical protein [Acidobacteriota bacterium]